MGEIGGVSTRAEGMNVGDTNNILLTLTRMLERQQQEQTRQQQGLAKLQEEQARLLQEQAIEKNFKVLQSVIN